MKKVFSFNSELHLITGVQKVLMDVHQAVSDCYDAKIVGLKPYKQVNKDLNIKSEDYVQWKNIFMFNNSILIVHERKYLLIFWILRYLLFQNISIVYIHHNIFHTFKKWTFMPRTIVSISDRITENLTDYFGVDESYIHKIYNCVRDKHPDKHKCLNLSNEVRILYPAFISSRKQQLDIVRNLRNKLDKRVKIHFAGTGILYEELKKEIEGDNQFVCLGFRNDIYSLMQNYDFVMLYSKNEGLPISLIEATMCGTPIICNDVGGNCEIAKNNYNAFVVNDWDELRNTLNKLPLLPLEDYEMMSVRGRRIYEENFTFDKFKSNYLKLISTLKI